MGAGAVSARKPDILYWVDMKLSVPLWKIPYQLKRAGVRGGKRSSLKACLDSRDAILRADPNASVGIYSADVVWQEVWRNPPSADL